MAGLAQKLKSGLIWPQHMIPAILMTSCEVLACCLCVALMEGLSLAKLMINNFFQSCHVMLAKQYLFK